MFDRSYLKATSQLLVFFATPLAAIILISAALMTMQDQERVSVVLLISGILTGILGLIWAAFSIVCPKCQSRLFWLAVRAQPQSNWLSWLLASEKCHKPNFRPDNLNHSGQRYMTRTNPMHKSAPPQRHRAIKFMAPKKNA